MAESPYHRPVAANLIARAIREHTLAMMDGVIGYTESMYIYDALRRAGYLTEEAMIPDEN